jgi:hypothetical protein
LSQSDWARAAEYWRGSTGIIIRRVQRGTPIGEALTGKRRSEAAQLSSRFWGLIKVVHRLASEQHDATGPSAETFQTAQWAAAAGRDELTNGPTARRLGCKDRCSPTLSARSREPSTCAAPAEQRRRCGRESAAYGDNSVA